MIEVIKNIPKRGWRPGVFLVYGPPKVGKSTIASKFSPKGTGDVVVLDLEAGYMEIECNRIPISSNEHLLEGLRYVATQDYGTIVIDSIDKVYEWGKKDVITFANRTKKGDDRYHVIGEIPEGVGWDRAKDITMQTLLTPATKLKEIGKVVVIVSHLKAPADQPGMDKIRTVDLPGSLARTITAAVDGIFLMYKDGPKPDDPRRITTIPYQGVDTGCRWEELSNKVFEIPKDDPFKPFREAINGQS